MSSWPRNYKEAAGCSVTLSGLTDSKVATECDARRSALPAEDDRFDIGWMACWTWLKGRAKRQVEGPRTKRRC